MYSFYYHPLPIILFIVKKIPQFWTDKHSAIIIKTEVIINFKHNLRLSETGMSLQLHAQVQVHVRACFLPA